MFDYLISLTGLNIQSYAFLALVTLIAGIVRGYSGFGFSALFILLATWVLPPIAVVPMVFFLEIVASIHLLPSVWSQIHWPRLRRIVIGSMLSIPFGIYVLAILDEHLMRIVISILVLILSFILLKGFSLKRYDRSSYDYGVGVFSGLFTGAAGVGGLAVVISYLAIHVEIAVIRATLITLFIVTDFYTAILGSFHGMVSQKLLFTCAFLTPFLFFGVSIGRKQFNKTNEAAFRKLTLILLIFLATAGMFNSLLKFV